ncbi:unnamed protein product [Haemonchus placei]|uniref:PITH domain-containing protein n=1 Tax=Haemonchus placei TaxID=6290 RepID=A0A0N4VZS5_HAEPC|nr:unnamed protein product [Haemonchus placei]
MNRHLGTEDKDWDIDSEEEEDNVRSRLHMTAIKNVRLRLNFDSDDCSETPKEVKPTSDHKIYEKETFGIVAIPNIALGLSHLTITASITDRKGFVEEKAQRSLGLNT